MSEPLPCSLLTRQWRDVGDALELVLWAVSDKGPVRIVVDDQKALCFVARDTELAHVHAGTTWVERRASAPVTPR